jgi:HEPN domain-containing protein
MKPHIEEAQLSLRLADRDVKAFEVLSGDPDVHPSVAGFHAQQAVEKSFKAVLFTHEIEFGRTHDLVKLANLIRSRGILVPVSDSQLRTLNPYAVTFRYDEGDIETIQQEEVANLVISMREWADRVVEAARKNEGRDSIDQD